VKPYFEEDGITIYHADCREVLPQLERESISCCVTSPPYWGLRYYEGNCELGLEPDPHEYVRKMSGIFRDVHRAMRSDGTLWVNLGDSYGSGTHAFRPPSKNSSVGGWRSIANQLNRNGFPAKQLVGIPWRVAFALQGRGWYLRQDIIWSKPNPMPESVTDRCTKSHEYIFLLSKSRRYFYNQDAILEPVSPNTHMRLSQNLASQIGSARANGGTRAERPMKAVGRKAKSGVVGVEKHNASFDAAVCLPVNERNKRSVWVIGTAEGLEEHTATFPEALVRPCILAGCRFDGAVLDPFCGTGTVLDVAKENGHRAMGIEIEERYCEIAAKRLSQKVMNFTQENPCHSQHSAV